MKTFVYVHLYRYDDIKSEMVLTDYNVILPRKLYTNRLCIVSVFFDGKVRL